MAKHRESINKRKDRRYVIEKNRMDKHALFMYMDAGIQMCVTVRMRKRSSTLP